MTVNALDYTGPQTHHAKRYMGSSRLRCVFGIGKPICESHATDIVAKITLRR